METFPTWGKELYKTLQNLMFAYVLGGKKKENQSTREKIHKNPPHATTKNDTRNLQPKK